MGSTPSHDLIELCCSETPKIEKIKKFIKEKKREIDFNLVVAYKSSEITCLVAAATISKSVELVEVLLATGQCNPFQTLKIEDEVRDVFEYVMTLVKRIDDEETTAEVMLKRKSSSSLIGGSRNDSHDFNNDNDSPLQNSLSGGFLFATPTERMKQQQKQKSTKSASGEKSPKEKLLAVGRVILAEMAKLREKPHNDFVSVIDRITNENKGPRIYSNTTGLNYWHLAIFDKSLSIFELLVDYSGACPFFQVTPGNGENIFHLFAKMRDQECALEMLREFCSSGLLSTNEAKLLFQARNRAGDETAFEVACREASPEMVTEFVINRIFGDGSSNDLSDLANEPVNKQQQNEATTEENNDDQITFLKGFTPLHVALTRRPENNRNGEMIKILQILFSGMKGVAEVKNKVVVLPGGKKENLLSLGISTRDVDVVHFLISNGIDRRSFPESFDVSGFVESSLPMRNLLVGGDFDDETDQKRKSQVNDDGSSRSSSDTDVGEKEEEHDAAENEQKSSRRKHRHASNKKFDESDLEVSD